MGVYIHYSFHAECSEEELLAQLRRLRKKVLRLPVAKVGKIERLEPIFHGMYLELLRQRGFALPAALERRLKGKWSSDYGDKCHLAAPVCWILVPKKLQYRYEKPALHFMKTTDLWKESELPESINLGSLTMYRKGLALELAHAMLRYGYLMLVNPGEGCEWVRIGLTTLRTQRTPVWLGGGFVKTQYATHFTTAHENVCRVLDFAKEEGLLLRAEDTCKFYERRNWTESGPIVNQETTFAFLMRGMISAGVTEAQKQGIEIEDLSHPATKNYNLVHVDPPKKKR